MGVYNTDDMDVYSTKEFLVKLMMLKGETGEYDDTAILEAIANEATAREAADATLEQKISEEVQNNGEIFYNSLAQLDLASGCSTADIRNAMADNSVAIIRVTGDGVISDLPQYSIGVFVTVKTTYSSYANRSFSISSTAFPFSTSERNVTR